MAKFGKNSSRGVSSFSTSSLSDIVFMLLFFFMVTTSMRETESKVTITLPKATESVKLERKDLASYISIGKPVKALQAKFGTDSRIQLNDSFKSVEEIRDFIAQEVVRTSNNKEKKESADAKAAEMAGTENTATPSANSNMTVVLRVDTDTRMGIVSEVKQELRRCGALNIMYSTIKGE